VDRIRVVNNLASDGAGGNANNFRLNPNDGVLAGIDPDLDFTGLPGGNANAPSTAVAYANSFAGAATTTLFGIVTGGDRLVTHGGAAPGFPTLQNVGLLGVDTSNNVGFDIQTQTSLNNIGFAALQTGAESEFYTINLTTGAATLVGDIANATVVRDIAVVPEILPGTTLFGVDTLKNLSRFNSALPSVILSTIRSPAWQRVRLLKASTSARPLANSLR